MPSIVTSWRLHLSFPFLFFSFFSPLCFFPLSLCAYFFFEIYFYYKFKLLHLLNLNSLCLFLSFLHFHFSFSHFLSISLPFCFPLFSFLFPSLCVFSFRLPKVHIPPLSLLTSTREGWGFQCRIITTKDAGEKGR
uniref:Uncharacterized protein n=1 Tax=Sphaerodactylus townsendi TaxID=933632 RepID=A0ACB8ELX2_9SAUR